MGLHSWGLCVLSGVYIHHGTETHVLPVARTDPFHLSVLGSEPTSVGRDYSRYCKAPHRRGACRVDPTRTIIWRNHGALRCRAFCRSLHISVHVLGHQEHSAVCRPILHCHGSRSTIHVQQLEEEESLHVLNRVRKESRIQQGISQPEFGAYAEYRAAQIDVGLDNDNYSSTWDWSSLLGLGRVPYAVTTVVGFSSIACDSSLAPCNHAHPSVPHSCCRITMRASRRLSCLCILGALRECGHPRTPGRTGTNRPALCCAIRIACACCGMVHRKTTGSKKGQHQPPR